MGKGNKKDKRKKKDKSKKHRSRSCSESSSSVAISSRSPTVSVKCDRKKESMNKNEIERKIKEKLLLEFRGISGEDAVCTGLSKSGEVLKSAELVEGQELNNGNSGNQILAASDTKPDILLNSPSKMLVDPINPTPLSIHQEPQETRDREMISSNEPESNLDQPNQEVPKTDLDHPATPDEEMENESDKMAKLEKELTNIYKSSLGEVETKEMQETGKKPNFTRVNFKEIPNWHRKVVIYNMPSNVEFDEMKFYFHTLLSTLNQNSTVNHHIINIETRDDGHFYIFELASKDDMEILINMDQTDWRGNRIRIQSMSRFFGNYNDTEGANVRKKEKKNLDQGNIDTDNKLHMSGIPPSAKDKEVRTLVEAFGQLKTFNLVKDPQNQELNRGFCFFEYWDEKVTDRALKGLQNMDIMDRKLKVQRASLNTKNNIKATEQKQSNNITHFQFGKSNFSKESEPSDDFYAALAQQLDVPAFASFPSRVIQMINVIAPEDVMDDLEYREIVEDIRNECIQFGTVLNVEIPRPDKTTSIAGPAVGKIFVKFSSLQSAKKARYRLSGRKYNRRIVVSSFYPENYFDVREFNYSDNN